MKAWREALDKKRFLNVFSSFRQLWECDMRLGYPSQDTLTRRPP
jgi:hypothetical protein